MEYPTFCCLINDLGSSPQPEGEARVLWWASQVVNETTMTEIEVSISILSWWNQINAESTNTVNLNAQICPKTPLVTAWLHVHILGSCDLIVSPW